MISPSVDPGWSWPQEKIGFNVTETGSGPGMPDAFYAMAGCKGTWQKLHRISIRGAMGAISDGHGLKPATSALRSWRRFHDFSA